jgi:hypothetical protein
MPSIACVYDLEADALPLSFADGETKSQYKQPIKASSKARGKN